MARPFARVDFYAKTLRYEPRNESAAGSERAAVRFAQCAFLERDSHCEQDRITDGKGQRDNHQTSNKRYARDLDYYRNVIGMADVAVGPRSHRFHVRNDYHARIPVLTKRRDRPGAKRLRSDVPG